ncbi:hypothetical protein [Sphingobacterium sp. LRF_L2]|uniref:hypothetical protein n=1 Tax=Sphingobacterium sp. LRF_L2 TaxID=3369421 RepID=UPI003F6174AC
MKTIYITINFFFCAIFFFSACTKTEYEQTKQPYNDILSFRIAGENSGIDSLSAIIAGDSISIYWDQLIDVPTRISPVIKLSAGATISPASGEAVDFSKNTVYTVTAEDGTTRTFRLTPIFNVPIPTISSFAASSPVVAWGHAILFSYQNMTLNSKRANYIFAGDEQDGETVKILSTSARETVSYALETVVPKHTINITGEYFLTGQGGSDDFRVFIRRLTDGYEIETPIETLSENLITARFPDYTAELDTGKHQLIFQMNGREFQGSEISIGAPAPGYLKGDFTFHQQGQALQVGDEIKFTFDNMHDDYEGSVTRFYGLDKVTAIEYVFAADGGTGVSYGNITTGNFRLEGNSLIHEVPSWMKTMNLATMKLRTISFVYPYSDRRGTTGYVAAKKVFPMPENALIIE